MLMGVMIKMKRERMIKIRVNDDENERLMESCEGKKMEVWMRREKRKINKGKWKRLVNKDVGVKKGRKKNNEMKIRKIMVKGDELRV